MQKYLEFMRHQKEYERKEAEKIKNNRRGK